MSENYFIVQCDLQNLKPPRELPPGNTYKLDPFAVQHFDNRLFVNVLLLKFKN